MAKTRFHAALEERLNENRLARMESLGLGGAADYPQYMYNVGYILGLKDALKVADEIEGELDR